MRYYLFIITCILFASCDQNKWNGYSLSSSGLYYKIHSLGDGVRKARPNDRVFAQITIVDQSNKILYKNGMQRGAILSVELGSTTNASISEALSLMHSGDSASFIFPKTIDVKSLTKGKLMEWNESYVLSIKLNRIVGETDNQNTAVEVVDEELEELKQLRAYLIENDIDPNKHTQGVYLKTIKSGNGIKASSGQNLWIHYSGKFLDGTEFDNTRKQGQLLDFQLGKPDQVIRAFEIALHHVDVGGKIQVISSSEFAFGESGSSTGIVPAHTSVVYEIELVKAI
ncbi:MAG: hypothetical protein CL840_14465 [Crocinitomicaceae bacterium]|nr:hypothetical protein [Crocinitomicaceae bacterium]|tara:strand:- start:1978 stop:2829 length:852 start_codon:yes stop_codon:yes gene_type:complete